MPELSLNRDKDIMFVREYPNQQRLNETSVSSYQARVIIEEVADELGQSPDDIISELEKGKVVEF